MSLKRIVIGFLVAILLLIAIFLYLLFFWRADTRLDPDWRINRHTTNAEGAITVRFTGTSTLLFSDGQTQWMTDGWFSRPNITQLLITKKISPDLPAIEKGLARNKVENLAAVIPLHSHYDHAMDSPEVARRTGAMLMGSESTANIGRGWGLPEDQIAIFENRVPVTLGAFTITPIETSHFQFGDTRLIKIDLNDPEITEPLIPPVSARDYKLGKAYALHVTHPRGNFVIVGSAGFGDGDLEGYDADLIFLGIGGLGQKSQDYQNAYWRETVTSVGASRVIPIHFDSLTAPITGDFKGADFIASLALGFENTLPEFFASKLVSHPELKIETLPRYDKTVIIE